MVYVKDTPPPQHPNHVKVSPWERHTQTDDIEILGDGGKRREGGREGEMHQVDVSNSECLNKEYNIVWEFKLP